MYRGDFRRKATLAEYGFRLPSCLDNRPLRFEEWDAMRPQTVNVSATPGDWEMNQTGGVFVEQVIRPTGLIDPPVEVRPARTQVDDLLGEAREMAARGLSHPCHGADKTHGRRPDRISARERRARALHAFGYRHDRARRNPPRPALGAFDVLVGINLLREGLDFPGCALVAILDADKEGFLRSETSLVQTIGRAARNVDGKVISTPTALPARWSAPWPKRRAAAKSSSPTMSEHNITPATIKRGIAGYSRPGL